MACRRGTAATIDPKFREQQRNNEKHLHTKNERAVRLRSSGRRPLPVCAVGGADAKPRRTAASNSGYSFSKTIPTSCMSLISIVAAVCPLRPSKVCVIGAFCLKTPAIGADFLQRLEKTSQAPPRSPRRDKQWRKEIQLCRRSYHYNTTLHLQASSRNLPKGVGVS